MPTIVRPAAAFGDVYFADSPVVVTVNGLSWPADPVSPFTVVRVKATGDGGKVVGEFHADTGQQTEIQFDVSSAMRAVWAEYDYSTEVSAAAGADSASRSPKSIGLSLSVEYLDKDGQFISVDDPAACVLNCAVGGLTELERSGMSGGSSPFGSASTKPAGAPERVGSQSITSQVDIGNGGTSSIFRSAAYTDTHILRDTTQQYHDFLFVNRRGAVETCSALMKESMEVSVETQKYARTDRPASTPSRSLAALGSDGRRSWPMSSGYVTREWAAWWALEFLGGKRRRWWMLYDGQYVPVIVEPAKKQVSIYDRVKQQMPSVEFTVTLALEG